MKRFFELFFKRPPVVFPIVALFLIFFTIYDATQWIGNENVMYLNWWRPVPIAIYTVFWIAATLFKRWGAIAFVIFTILHLAAIIFLKESMWVGRLLDNFMVNPVPLALIFSAILLIYYRKIK